MRTPHGRTVSRQHRDLSVQLSQPRKQLDKATTVEIGQTATMGTPMPSRDLMSRIEVWAKTWVPAFVVEERSRYSQPMPHPNGKGTSTIVSAMNAGQSGGRRSRSRSAADSKNVESVLRRCG